MLPIQYQTCEDQLKLLKDILQRNEQLVVVLKKLHSLSLPQWYVAGGAISQTVWNYLHGFDLIYGIKDYDVVYFDEDTSYEAEDRFIKLGEKVFADTDCKVEIRNQARVHLWYKTKFGSEIPPYTSIGHAISSWLSTAACIGVTVDSHHNLAVFAPYGLADIFSLVVRPNRVVLNQKNNYDLKAQQWREKWPKLQVVSWE